MRVALLSYRSKTHCGGQGVYVRHLSRGLVELGHDVEVFSGQPYPEVLDPRVRLTKVPSLDLYREPDPFRVPWPNEIKSRIDLLELLTTWTAGFPEPRTFSLRAARVLAERLADFDVVHDNQCLGTGLLKIAELGLPVVATVHHPITRDRVLDVAAARWWRKPLVRRWYGFAEMQKDVARQIPELLTVSSTSAADIAEDFAVSSDQLHVVPLGVDTALFKPAEHRVRNRIIAIASADVPLKGVSHLLHAVARLRVERDLELQLVAKLEPNGPTEKLIAELGISDIVHSSSGLSDSELADLLASAEVACIPSLYEGFSLPAVEAMASGTPIVASRAGALPEVVGSDGECARLVRPADVDELTAVLGELLDSPLELRRLGANGRQARARRVQLGIRCGTDGCGLRAWLARGWGNADRRLRPVGDRRGHEGDRRRLRRGQAFVRGIPAGRRRDRLRPECVRSERRRRDPAGDEGPGRGARIGKGRGGQGRCTRLALRRWHIRLCHRVGDPRACPGRRPGDLRTRPCSQTGWCAGHHGAEVAARTGVLGTVGRIPRQRGRAHQDLPRRRTARQGARSRPAADPHPSRARAALAVLVAEMRCRHIEFGASRW